METKYPNTIIGSQDPPVYPAMCAVKPKNYYKTYLASKQY